MRSKATTAMRWAGMRELQAVWPDINATWLVGHSRPEGPRTNNGLHHNPHEEPAMNQPPKRALIVIDVQNEYVTGNLRIEHPPIDHSLANFGRAMDAASAAGIPVIAIEHLAPEWSQIFAGTDLADYLKQRGIDTLSVVGYMIHHCDDSTVRQAHHEGWQVELLHD